MSESNQSNTNVRLEAVLCSIVSVILICAVIALAVMFFAQKNLVTQLQQSVVALETAAVIEESAPTVALEVPAVEAAPMYVKGNSFVVNSYFPVICSTNSANPCDGVTITTEIDLTEPSDGLTYTGEFYIRAYRDTQLLSEYAITRTFLRFGGDGESNNPIHDTDRVMTIAVSDMNTLKDHFGLTYGFDTTWDAYGYRSVVLPTDGASSFDNEAVNFINQSAEEFVISIPQ